MDGTDNPRTRKVRELNPYVMLVVGLLAGALVAAVAQDPASDATEVAAEAGAADEPTSGLGGGDDPAALTGGATSTSIQAAQEGSDTRARSSAESSGATASAPGGGGTVADGGPTTTVAAATEPADCPGEHAEGVRGVTEDTIKVGFGIPNIDAVVPVFGEQVDPGDMIGHIEAILDGMRRDGRLPVCGRDIEPVYREYQVLDPSASRAACVGFIEEDKVFMVVALFAWGAPECVAIEYETILFDLFASETTLAQTPYLFAMDPAVEVIYRSMAHWMVETGLVQGKKMGVYYNSSSEVIKPHLLDTLEDLGYPVEVVVQTDTSSGGLAADPNDGVAVQRFKTEGVDLAMVLVGGRNFYQQAEAQDYKALWVLQGVALASDATTGSHPPETFDGATTLLFDHMGEQQAGYPPTPAQAVCFRYWEEAGHKGSSEHERWDYGKGQTLRESCDQIKILELGLRATGRELTRDRLVRGLETIRDVPLAYYGDAVITPEKHYVGSQNVEQHYTKDCECWITTNNWVPLYSR